MIDIKSGTGKVQFWRAFSRLLLIHESRFGREVRSILNNFISSFIKNELRVGGLDWIWSRAGVALSKAYQRHAISAMSAMVDLLNSALQDAQKQGTINQSDAFWSALVEYIESRTARMVSRVGETIKARLRELLRRGAEAGMSEEELTALIRSELAMNAWQSQRIARTELHSAMQFASLEAAKSSGKFQTKEWITSQDEKVRHTHWGAHGEVVALNSFFQKTGESLEFPGDPRGTPGNIINCRCVMVFHTTNQTTSQSAQS